MQRTQARQKSAAVCVLLAGCSSKSPSEPGGPSADAGGRPSIETARQVASTAAECAAIAPFYWEIGDTKGSIGSGSEGGTRFEAGTEMQIASASKWVFGAYVVERFKDDLSQIDLPAMTMRSGYTSLVYTTCLAAGLPRGCA